jgi:hypothetical protein
VLRAVCNEEIDAAARRGATPGGSGPVRYGGISAVTAIALAGCGLGGGGESAPGPLVDERAGEYRGVAMGHSIDDVRRLLGPDKGGSGFGPAGMLPAEAGVPQAIPAPGSLKPDLLRYQDVAFLIGPRGVYAFIVTEDGARTRREVAIGDDLDDAHDKYDLRCIDVAAGESPLGGVTTYPSCSTTLGGRTRVWVGRDPIRSITLLSLRHARNGGAAVAAARVLPPTLSPSSPSPTTK